MDFGIRDPASESPELFDFDWVALLHSLPRQPADPLQLRGLEATRRPLIITSLDCAGHLVRDGDSESPARIRTVLNRLHSEFDHPRGRVDWTYVRAARPALLPALAHSVGYLSGLDAALRFLRSSDDAPRLLPVDCCPSIPAGETLLSAGTGPALLATAESLRVAINAVLRGDRYTGAV